MSSDCLVISDDHSSIILYPYVGQAAVIGQTIKEAYSPMLYMNGYCWSAMLHRYCWKNKPATVSLFETDCSENSVIFHTAPENVIPLAEYLRTIIDNSSILPDWVIETDFDDWDDW